MSSTITAKDLTKEAPASPGETVGGYVILARMTDKGRATNIGEYHFDCPLDNMLFGFKGVKGADVKAELDKGATNEEIAAWLDAHGTPKTPEEVKAWSDGMLKATMHGDPEKGEWFDGECAKLGLDGSKETLFSWLDADDKATFKK